MKAVILFETTLFNGPVVICAMEEDGRLLVRTSKEKQHLLPQIEAYLQAEGWIDYFLHPDNNPYVEQ